MWCPNPDCPARKRSGHPAQYREGFDSCAECGAALTAEVDASLLPQLRTRKAWPYPLRQRVAFTLVVVAVLAGLLFVPNPLLNGEAVDALMANPFGIYVYSFGPPFGPFLQGIWPFLAAFVLVELVALAVPRWRRRRHGDARFRDALFRWSWWTGLAVAAAGGLSSAFSLEALDASMFGLPPLVNMTGWSLRLSMAGIMALGSSAHFAAAVLISRRGIGNGFAVMSLFQLALALPGWVVHLHRDVDQELIGPLALVIIAAAAFGLFALTVWGLTWSERTTTRSGSEASWVRVPTCGSVPVDLAVLITGLGPTLWGYGIDLVWLHKLGSILPGDWRYFALEVAFILVFVPVFSTLFYWRRREAIARDGVRTAFRRAMLATWAFLFTLVGARALIVDMFHEAVLYLPFTTTLLFATAIGLDLVAEFRCRRDAEMQTDLEVAAEFQDVCDAIEARDAIGDQPVVIQGLYYRSLTYFFGPFVPLRILTEPASHSSNTEGTE